MICEIIYANSHREKQNLHGFKSAFIRALALGVIFLLRVILSSSFLSSVGVKLTLQCYTNFPEL